MLSENGVYVLISSIVSLLIGIGISSFFYNKNKAEANVLNDRIRELKEDVELRRIQLLHYNDKAEKTKREKQSREFKIGCFLIFYAILGCVVDSIRKSHKLEIK